MNHKSLWFCQAVRQKQMIAYVFKHTETGHSLCSLKKSFAAQQFFKKHHVSRQSEEQLTQP